MTGYSILLIEDDEFDAILFLRLIDELSDQIKIKKCTHVKTLKEGYYACIDEEFDIIYSDLNLTDSTGSETSKVLNQLINNTPLVIISNNNKKALVDPEITSPDKNIYINKDSLTRETLFLSIKDSLNM